jgi:hypothetical protein
VAAPDHERPAGRAGHLRRDHPAGHRRLGGRRAVDRFAAELFHGAAAARRGRTAPGALLLGATAGGLAGSLFDSLLGATVQTIYYCDGCGKETERRVHRCGQATRRLRGWPWLDNDGVNFVASLVGAAVAGLLAGL